MLRLNSLPSQTMGGLGNMVTGNDVTSAFLHDYRLYLPKPFQGSHDLADVALSRIVRMLVELVDLHRDCLAHLEPSLVSILSLMVLAVSWHSLSRVRTDTATEPAPMIRNP